MNFSEFLENQPQVAKLLNKSVDTNHLVNVYLFDGPSGTHKLEAAYYLSALIFCQAQEKPCFNCAHCKRILDRTHPSVFHLKAEKNMITKPQVDALIREFSLTALEEGKRVFIIEGIEKANKSASNSLLKFLEELSATDYGVLITENLSSVIETIKSRGQIITFKKAKEKDVIALLTEEKVPENIAKIVVKLTNSLEKGLDIANDPDFLETYDLAKKIIKNLLLGNESPIITINLLGKKFFKLEDRKYHQYFLDMLVYFYNDILMYQLGNIEDIVYFDLLNNIDGEIEMEYEKIIANIELLLEAKNKLNFNINIDLMYFDLFLEMEKING
ncbi:MAG TPA: hypothetical protein PLH77_02430 [Bacilli bacterium]|jgi:DNA polymerase-3 subunit delta'|nr:hypothetical protein [Bacilli bacterium]